MIIHLLLVPKNEWSFTSAPLYVYIACSGTTTLLQVISYLSHACCMSQPPGDHLVKSANQLGPRHAFPLCDRQKRVS